MATYSLYVCQLTILHGDEGHYLRVTQSLLRDGDLDLSNNLDGDAYREFHVLDPGVHRAPASPHGTVYSVHPVGLSVLMAPAYWAGFELWSNPRLGCALGMALMTAASLALAFVWLVRVGIGSTASCTAVFIAGTTTPVFLYSSQIFPEVPAVLLCLVVLGTLAHWQTSSAGYQSLGRWEVPQLGLLMAAIALLPFLHPRMAVLSGVLALPIILQAWNSPQRRHCLRAVGPAAALGVVLHIAFNLSISDGWLGPFRPGNAWSEDALRFSTWMVSIPGHWLHQTKGLVNSSPIYLLSLTALILLAVRARRLAVVAGAFYLASAGVNGLHPDWTFGFCLPARFLITALPVLLLGLALGLQSLSRKGPLVWFLVAFALCASWDSVLQSLVTPEVAYNGLHLGMRAVTDIYPLDIHFPTSDTALNLVDVCFWALALSALTAGSILKRFVPRSLCLATVALIPGMFGYTNTWQDRMSVDTSPYLPMLTDQGSVVHASDIPITLKILPILSTTGRQLESGTFLAQDDRPGVLTSYGLPVLFPGDYRLSALLAIARGGSVPNYAVVSQPVSQVWERREIVPLTASVSQKAVGIEFRVSQPTLGYSHFTYSGSGSLSVADVQLEFRPRKQRPQLERVRTFDLDGAPSSDGQVLALAVAGLPAGSYTARFGLQGLALSTVFERQPKPIVLAAWWNAAGESRSPTDETVEEWFDQDRRFKILARRPKLFGPQIEKLVPPWWLNVPFKGDRAFDLSFALAEPQEVWFLIKYDGGPAVHIHSLSLLRERDPARPPWKASIYEPE